MWRYRAPRRVRQELWWIRRDHATLCATPDIWSAAACHSGDMGFEVCYCPTCHGPARTRRRENSIEKWWQQLEAAQKHPEFLKVINALAMAPSYDADPTQFLGIRLPGHVRYCEVIEERWAIGCGTDPVVCESKPRRTISAG